MLTGILTIVVALVCAIPLGAWIKKVMNHDVAFVNRTENQLFKVLGISEAEMSWKKYLCAVLAFSAVGLLVLMGIFLLEGMDIGMAFNTACSFVTNTNWQSYTPESLSWISQSAGIIVQNFLSAAVGMAVLFALIRGLIYKQSSAIGNFWQDLMGALLYVLLPVNLVLALIIGASGVPMQAQSSLDSALIEPVAVTESGEILPDADIENGVVTMDGQTVEGAQIVTSQQVGTGLGAAQEAIKQSGTNGGGYTLANSASPFENPSAFSNLVENAAILLLPMALCFSFGLMIKNRRQGYALFAAMAILFAAALAGVLIAEMKMGSLEGKEVRFGLLPSGLWAASTTAASSGSSNLAMNSLSSMSQMVCMLLMQVGEVIFGGVGSGLYGMLAFVILAVFIAGLMVGRTPEFLNKKIEPFEMKWAVILCLASPVCILIGSALGSLFPPEGVNAGAHGFSQILYAYSSMGANNGSSMAGFSTSGLLLNVLGGALMLAARFVPMAGALAIAGSLAAKKPSATSASTLATDGGMFVFLLVTVVLLVGALSFFPALALGPLAECLR